MVQAFDRADCLRDGSFDLVGEEAKLMKISKMFNIDRNFAANIVLGWQKNIELRWYAGSASQSDINKTYTSPIPAMIWEERLPLELFRPRRFRLNNEIHEHSSNCQCISASERRTKYNLLDIQLVIADNAKRHIFATIGLIPSTNTSLWQEVALIFPAFSPHWKI